MKSKLKKIIKNNNLIYGVYNSLIDYYRKNLISDEEYLKKRFLKKTGRTLELEKPELFNDKLQWLKLNWSDSVATKSADKYEVREVIENRIGKEYLSDLLGVYNNPEEIDLNQLPEKFVLKGTHGSGFNIICTDKSQLDWDAAKQEMKRWLEKNYYWGGREPVYKDIKPRIIAEGFLKQDDGDELRDYRFFCFNGEPKFISVDFNINDKSKTRRNLYDLDWNLLDAEISYPKENDFKVKKPDKLSQMIDLSRKLSKGFPHARIDFYYINNKIIFGEITFFHQGGTGEIRPSSFEKQMGQWLKLPSK